jgi:hypothetical protein
MIYIYVCVCVIYIYIFISFLPLFRLYLQQKYCGNGANRVGRGSRLAAAFMVSKCNRPWEKVVMKW